MTASLKKRHGGVYTPQPIVDLILDNTLPHNADALARAVICDPACGDSAFLTAAARRALSSLIRADELRNLAATVSTPACLLRRLMRCGHTLGNKTWRTTSVSWIWTALAEDREVLSMAYVLRQEAGDKSTFSRLLDRLPGADMR